MATARVSTELPRAIDLVASHLLFRQDRFVQLVEMAMRSLTQISDIDGLSGDAPNQAEIAPAVGVS